METALVAKRHSNTIYWPHLLLRKVRSDCVLWPDETNRESKVWLRSSSFSRSDFEPHCASTELPRMWFESTSCFKKHTPTIVWYAMVFSFQAERAMEVASDELPRPPRWPQTHRHSMRTFFVCTSYFLLRAFHVCRCKRTHLLPAWLCVLGRYAVRSADEQTGRYNGRKTPLSVQTLWTPYAQHHIRMGVEADTALRKDILTTIRLFVLLKIAYFTWRR